MTQFTVHYITCIALHCITLHYIALHCITLHYKKYVTLHYITLHVSNYMFDITLHYLQIKKTGHMFYVVRGYIILHYIALHDMPYVTSIFATHTLHIYIYTLKTKKHIFAHKQTYTKHTNIKNIYLSIIPSIGLTIYLSIHLSI